MDMNAPRISLSFVRFLGQNPSGWLGLPSLDRRRASVPADDDPPLDTGQGQGCRFRLDGIARRARETAPGLDHHRRPAHVARSRRSRPRPGGRPARREASRASGDARRRGPGVRGRLPGGGRTRLRSGSSRAGATGPGAARNVGSSRLRIHASPTGVRTAVSDLRSASNASLPGSGRCPPTRRTPRAWSGPKMCRYRRASSRRALRGSTSGRRHGPDGRLPRALPPDQDRAGRRRVPKRVGVTPSACPASS